MTAARSDTAAPRPAADGLLRGVGVPALLLGEALLVVLGGMAGGPFAGALVALALAYLVLAYRKPAWAWALVWFVIPFDVERVIGGGAAITVPTEPMILLALLAWILRALVAATWTLPSSRLNRPLALLGAWTLASAVWSLSPVSTLKAWVMMSGYVLFGYVAVLGAEPTPASRERWLRTIAAMGAAWSLFGIAKVVFTDAGGRSLMSIASTYSFGAFRPFFSEHGTYAAYIAMLLPPALIATLESRGARRIAFGASTILMITAIVLAFARATWLALLVVVPLAIVLWAAWRRDAKRLVWPVALVVAVLLVVAALGVGNQVSKHATTVASSRNISNLERLNRWQTAILMTESRPLTGVGFGCYVVGYAAYRSKTLPTDQTYVRMGVHSEVLKLLSENGVPGLLLALAFLGAVAAAAFRVFRRSPDPGERAIVLGVLAGLSMYLVNGVFNAYLAETKVTVPFWAAIGLIGALDRRLPRPAR